MHLITVAETTSVSVLAGGAKLAVEIAGQSFFTGNEAFKKAADLATLVQALSGIGVSSDDIELLKVLTEVESGLLSKSSTAAYHIIINCHSIDSLGAVLTAIASGKNSRILAMSWQYTDLQKLKRNLVQSAVRDTRESAQAIALSLSVPLIGVHKLTYTISGLDTDLQISNAAGFQSSRARKAKSEALSNLSLSHSATISATVTAEFVVGPFADSRT